MGGEAAKQHVYNAAPCSLLSKGAEMLAAGLRYNNALQVLSLAGNSVRASGCIAIGDALRDNEKLQELDLSDNDISSSACLSVARFLADNSTLRVLALRRNPVGERGGQVLLQAAACSPTLQTLDLEGANFASYGGAQGPDAAFNPMNPNGHYRLDLSGAAQFAARAWQTCVSLGNCAHACAHAL